MEQLMSEKKEKKISNVPTLRFSQYHSDWTPCSLSEIANVVGGGTPDTADETLWNGDIQWFTPTEVGHSKYVSKSIRTISQRGLKKSSAKILPKGSILLSSRATVGECSIAQNDCTTNQGFQSLVPKTTVNNEFLYYLAQTKKRHFIKYASGSTFLEISNSEIEKTKCFIPRIEEQTKSAEFLSLIDRKLEVQNKIIRKYETLIKGIRHKIFSSVSNGEDVTLGSFLEEYSEKNTENNLQSVAVGKYGIRKREDIYSKELSSDYSKNKVIRKDTLIIGMGSTQIDIGILTTDNCYCVSPAYTTYHIKGIDSFYLQEYLIDLNPLLSVRYMVTSARQGKTVNKDDLMQHILVIHSDLAQKEIHQFFQRIYGGLLIEKRMLSALQKQKSFLLQSMFI